MPEEPSDDLREALLEADLQAGLDAQRGQLERNEWVDEETGYRCVCFLNQFKAFCGYVEIPPGHPFYGISQVIIDPDYEISVPGKTWRPGFRTNPAFDPVEDMRVHGGVTFAGVPAGCADGTWWIGFDCLHAWDLAPGLEDTLRTAMGPEEYERHRNVFPQRDTTFKGLDYVKGECHDLAVQLAAVAAAKPHRKRRH